MGGEVVNETVKGGAVEKVIVAGVGGVHEFKEVTRTMGAEKRWV